MLSSKLPSHGETRNKKQISNTWQSEKLYITTRSIWFPCYYHHLFNFLKIVSSHFHNKVRRAIGMAQLPRRVGKCQEWMRFGTPEWRVPAESRADFPGRTRRHAPATDSTLQANRDYCSAAAALSCLHANRSAIPARPGASGTGFWFTQLSLQEAGSSIDGS